MDEANPGGPERTTETALEEWGQLIQERAEAEAAYEAEIAPFKEAFEARTADTADKLSELETWFLNQAETSGQDSFAGGAGTVSVSSRETPKIADADSFFAWAESTNNSSLLQKRISVTEYRKYQSANPDVVPPGVTIDVAKSAKFKAS